MKRNVLSVHSGVKDAFHWHLARSHCAFFRYEGARTGYEQKKSGWQENGH